MFRGGRGNRPAALKGRGRKKKLTHGLVGRGAILGPKRDRKRHKPVYWSKKKRGGAKELWWGRSPSERRIIV